MICVQRRATRLVETFKKCVDVTFRDRINDGPGSVRLMAGLNDLGDFPVLL